MTNWEHGDIILDLEVMIPKGSNSGIYLQGRYEVQLLDSWGKIDPAFSDIGGIYRNWEKTPGDIYMGKAPLTNAAKAPGLWQHFTIGFKAPRFDENGQKVANAKFVFVDLNGVRIHENVEVPLPTGTPIEKNEVAQGPILIQGDHGPVAFRNIRYALLEEKQVAIKDIKYEVFNGPFEKGKDLNQDSILLEGTQSLLNANLSVNAEKYSIKYTGVIETMQPGTFRFRFNYNGGIEMKIGNNTFSSDYRRNGTLNMEVELKNTSETFELIFYKNDSWVRPRLGWFNTTSYPIPLHSMSSLPSVPNRPAPIYVNTKAQPQLLRAFLDFNGDRKQRLTHTIGVGHPKQVHYIYDLKAGSIACVWRGPFLDATPMWHRRGDGSFRPVGAAQYLFTGHSIARLATENTPFPKSLNEANGFANQGYQIDAISQMPRFKYAIDSVEVTDFIDVNDSGNGFFRSVSVENGKMAEQIFVKLAQGKQIEALPNGIFIVDQSYYIEISANHSPKIRTIENHQELIVALDQDGVQYSLNW